MATYLVVHVNFGVGAPFYVASVERGLSATGPWVPVGQVALINDDPSPDGGDGYFYDNTVAFDTPVWYRFTQLDEAGTPGASTIVGPLTLASGGSIVISDPARPWADIEFQLCETTQGVIAAGCAPSGPELVWSRFGNRDRVADAGLFPVLDAERPADIYARRKDHSGTGTFLTKTLAAIDRVYDLFTAGGPLYLRAPAAYGRTDFAFQPGDLSEAFLTELIDQRLPFRLWSFPYVVVDLPLGPQQGTSCANWCAVAETYPTFADLTATGHTWGAIATGETVCPGTTGDGYGFGPYGDGPYGDGG